MMILEKLTSLEKESEEFGFYWPNVEMIFNQIRSEIAEVEDVIKQNEGQDRLQEEVGDLLHAAFSLCIYLGLDAEETLVKTTEKYGKRFDALKKVAREKGLIDLNHQSIEANQKLWNDAKKLE